MAKKYEFKLSRVDGYCSIYDISSEPKKLEKVEACRFVRVFSIHPETHALHVQAEFPIQHNFQHNVNTIIELEKSPCTKRVIPADAKGLPEVFFFVHGGIGFLYIREDIAKVSYGPMEVTGMFDTNVPLQNTCTEAAVSRQVSVGMLGVTVKDDISLLSIPILKLDALYHTFADELKYRGSSLSRAREIFKKMEGVLIDADTLTKVWASRSVEKILSFNMRELNSWIYSDEAKAMGLPKCGDHCYGIVKSGFDLVVAPIRITRVTGKNIEFVPAEEENKPTGCAILTYTVPTDQWADSIFTDEGKAKAALSDRKMRG